MELSIQNIDNKTINNVCRTCLSESNGLQPIYLVNKVNEIDFIEILEQCASVHVSNNKNIITNNNFLY